VHWRDAVRPVSRQVRVQLSVPCIRLLLGATDPESDRETAHYTHLSRHRPDDIVMMPLQSVQALIPAARVR